MIDTNPRVASTLEKLVAFDTRNPMGTELPMAEHLGQALTGLGAERVEVIQHAGHASTYAVFGSGTPTRVLNAHIDTVPDNSGYSGDPHKLIRREDRLVGLGSADTKGAIAAILEALARRREQGGRIEGIAILFSGDEELGGQSIRHFLSSARIRGLTHAIVCEPTGCRVGRRHRGLHAFRVRTNSAGGHSSLAGQVKNPLAHLARVAVALETYGERNSDLGPEGLKGVCMNIAGFDGGVAFNVIPSTATLTFSVRPSPGVDRERLLREIRDVATQAAAPLPLAWEDVAYNPAFATRDLPSFGPILGATLDAPIDLPYGTEAGQFIEAGIDAVVFGPGRVEQAHAADEFVEIAELETAVTVLGRALG